MTVTKTEFDLETLQRGYAKWDIDALLSLYADEIEYTQIDRDNPPSSPLVRRGRDVYRSMFGHCRDAGVKAHVENAVAQGDRAAATIVCEFPGGRTVVGNSIFELRDGRAVREFTVASGDT